MGRAIGKLFDISGTNFRGTAFAVSPTRALTAFHCVGSPTTGTVEQKKVLLRFLNGFETEAAYIPGSPERDYAILALDRWLEEDLTLVPLMIRPSEKDRSPCEGWPLHTQAAFYGHVRCGGYPEVYEKQDLTQRPDITYIGGEIRADETESSIFGGIPAIELYSPEISGRLDLHGMSGGPVMVRAEQAGGLWAAIGLVRWNPPDDKDNRLGRGGQFFATPVTQIIEAQRDLLGDAQIINLKPPSVDPQNPVKPRQHFEPELVPVPAGPFIWGSDYDEDMPRQVVELPAFCIGKYPVTNKQFHMYVKDTRRLATTEMMWDGNKPYSKTEEYPVAGVTWNQAMAYCKWLRNKTDRPYRLPTEAQWEKAARGTDGRLYPWGPNWKEGRCNTGETITAKDAFGQQSDYGCFDLVGNTYEWTLTIWGRRAWKRDEEFAYHWDEDDRNNPANLPNMRRVIRGGRQASQMDYRCSYCDSFRPNKPGLGSNPIGFRVALLLND